MRASIHRTSFFSLIIASISFAACGSDGGDSTSTTGSSSSSGAGGSGDVCAGQPCGSPCSTCPPGGMCNASEACDASGKCVQESLAVCSMCPDTEPVEGSACPKMGLVCDLDDGIIIVCRARTQCSAMGWTNLAPGCSSSPMADPTCPAAAPAPMTNCSTATDPYLCEYGESFCGCSDCLGGPCSGQAKWVCAEPPSAPCPAIAPRLGSVCADEGAKCVYGSCSLGGTSIGRDCYGGIWIEQIPNCPQ